MERRGLSLVGRPARIPQRVRQLKGGPQDLRPDRPSLYCLVRSAHEACKHTRPSDFAAVSPIVRYYFHLHDDVDAPDDEGQELPSLDAAREWARGQARAVFGQLAKDEGRVVLSHFISIADGEGEVLDTIRFHEAVKVEN